MTALFKQNLASLLVFVSLSIFFVVFYIIVRNWFGYRGRIRKRLLAPSSSAVSSREKLSNIRQSRSLTSEGHYATPLMSLNRLMLQSGSTLGLGGLAFAASACAGAVAFIAWFAGFSLWAIIPIAAAAGILLPLITLRAMREGRQRRFEDQLPDAIDTLVRSLKAGHAISIAIASVAKHMPDPIGSEFRLTAAEMTYGLDLETAMINLHSRVGQEDLGLVALAVSIQSKTGGNLAEILSNLASIIRRRFKLRRKAYALAAEGRFSALILSGLPLLLFGILYIISPNYYRDVWDAPLTKPGLFAAMVWMLLGDYIMYRMVRIRV